MTHQIARVGLMTLVALCGLSCSVLGAVPPAPEEGMAAKDDAGLPNFDIRFDASGLPTQHVRDALVRHAKPGAAATKLAQLRASVQDVSIDDAPLIGTAGFVRSWSQFLTSPDAKAAPLTVLQNFMADYGAMFELDAAEISAARITRNFTDDHNGVTHLTLQQLVKGVDIFDSGIKASVTRDGRLINVSSTMLPRPAGDFVVADAKMSDIEAIRAAATSVGVTVTTDPTPAEDPEGPSRKRRWNNSEDFRADQAITTQFVYFPMTRDELRAAWWVVIPTRGVGNTYELVIDAADGKVLHRQNELCSELGSATMLVYTGRAPADGWPPNCAGSASRSAVTINPSQTAPASPFGWLDTNGVAGPEFTDTRGNNVDAHTDTNADNVADPGSRPDGGANAVFAFPLDLTQDPTQYANAVVVQGFYWANLYHDRLYSFGFTEAAGNFQTNNYGRGGIGNDAVQLDCQDGSGTNNSNFGTPADGQAPRCQMYLWTLSTPHRDATLDATILFHELTHGLSNRLTGGPANASALNATQSGGMGEGWSDFIAMCLTSIANDDPNGTYPMATYSLGQACGGAGIRRRPYSSNMAVDPLTFDAYGTAGTTSYGIARSTEVHDSGELWCTTLWECRAGLFAAYGFAANDLIIQLVVDGMKLQPANPSFTQARDAILAADLADYGGANQRILWTAFARRGLGAAASTPSSSATSITIDTTVPASTENGFAERGDAGDMPATAQTVFGSGAPTRITGTLGASDVDLYRITICDAASFSASTVGGPTGFNTMNTQLFLFTLAGNPITFNDDSASTTQSRITGTFVPGSGDYLLAVSGADRDPVSSAGAMWLDTPATTERAPDGPGAGGALTGWTGTGASGSYAIQLTGVCAAPAPTTPASPAAWGAATPNVVYGACTPPGNIGVSVYVVSGTSPASTGVSVTLDASAIGAGSVPLSGSGGANALYSATLSVGPRPGGNYLLPYHVADAQGRAFDGTVLYTVIEQSGTCCLSGGVCVASNCTDCAAQSGTFHPGSVGCVLLPCLGHSETEPNNTIATANNADGSFGRFTGDVYHMGISGALSTSTDADYFNIGTLQAGDVLTVSESGLATGIATLDDTFVRLYRAGTSAVVASDDDSGPGTDSLIWRFTIPTTDTYYVRAFKFTAANVGTYRLGILLENSGPAPATGGTFSAEVEPNDTIATANNASNAWRQVQYVSDNAGAIAAADNDFFAYTLHAGDVASVRVFSTSNLDAKVTLRDPAGTIVATEDGTSAGPVADSVIMGYNVPTTGVYTVNVASSGTTTGTYNEILYLSSNTTPPLPCGSADFNCDGDVGTDADISSFFACLAGDCPASPCTSSADFNGDGDVGTDADIEGFFRVLAGGSC